jgi:hypothetical protein
LRIGIRVARTLIGTPYLHQARLLGVGIDCIGVPILVAKELGLGDFDVADYPRRPNGRMVEFIQQVCAPLDDLEEGALLVFNVSDTPRYCAIASR